MCNLKKVIQPTSQARLFYTPDFASIQTYAELIRFNVSLFFKIFYTLYFYRGETER
jgi:hypothetical protein